MNGNYFKNQETSEGEITKILKCGLEKWLTKWVRRWTCLRGCLEMLVWEDTVTVTCWRHTEQALHALKTKSISLPSRSQLHQLDIKKKKIGCKLYTGLSIQHSNKYLHLLHQLTSLHFCISELPVQRKRPKHVNGKVGNCPCVFVIPCVFKVCKVL